MNYPTILNWKYGRFGLNKYSNKYHNNEESNGSYKFDWSQENDGKKLLFTDDDCNIDKFNIIFMPLKLIAYQHSEISFIYF